MSEQNNKLDLKSKSKSTNDLYTSSLSTKQTTFPSEGVRIYLKTTYSLPNLIDGEDDLFSIAFAHGRSEK